MMEKSEISARDFQEAARELAEDTGYSLPSVENAMLRVKNVTSKSFGVVAHNPANEEIVFNLVLRNTTVPVNVQKKFYTATENQKTVLIRIMESETSEIEIPLEHATEIKTAVLHLPPNLPADLPIEIAFDLNEEGRLSITAIETREYRKIQVQVDTASVIGGEEFEKAKQRSQNLVIH
jgi:molecular chaperone DnaK (HSP70)